MTTLPLEDTRAVRSPMAHPRRNDPRKMPMKVPMDRNKASTSKCADPSPVLYSSIDLQGE